MKPRPSLRRRKQDFVRGAIWDAAVDLFAIRGFDGTTIDDIARAAGVSRRSFFRYFSSKNDLMGQGIVTYGAMITEAIRACPPSATLWEVVQQTVSTTAVEAAAQPRARKLAHIAASSTAAREAQLSQVASPEDNVSEAYRARRRASGRQDLMPRLLAELTLSMLDVTFREWMKKDGQEIRPTVGRIIAAMRQLICARKRAR